MQKGNVKSGVSRSVSHPQPMLPLAGKAFLVTGAARRVGAAIVRRLHVAGASVLIHYREHESEAQALAAALNGARAGSAIAARLDLAHTAALPSLVDAALSAFGRLDGLVNNASAYYPTPMGTITLAHWQDLMASNLQAPLFLSQAAAPALTAAAGAIVNIVDIHAERPLKDYVVYTAAKAGLAGLTRSLALELAPAVRVNGVSPGPIEWPDAPSGAGQIPAAERERIIATTPLGREGGVDAIARAVAYFFTDADYVTGQILAVDGGRSIFL
jgi:pteridine reductase